MSSIQVFPSYDVINDVIMSDADGTPGREPHSVAASFVLFSVLYLCVCVCVCVCVLCVLCLYFILLPSGVINK